MGAHPAPAASLLTSSNLTTLEFFGDSLTDEGQYGRTAPVMWPGVLRNDISVMTGTNYAIGGATTSIQPSFTFGNSSFLGQVNSFVTSGGSAEPKTGAGVWIGANNIWIGASQRQPMNATVTAAAADVTNGIRQLKAAGVSTVILLGVYDMSLTNAYKLAGSDTIAVRNAAAMGSAQYNALLSQTSVGGTTIVYFNIANFINHLQTNPQAYGITRVLPLQPGEACDTACQQTSIFADTIHLSSRTQQLIGDYVATGTAIYNSDNLTYGAIAANVGSALVAVPMSSYLTRSAAHDLVRTTLARLNGLHEPGRTGLAPFSADDRPGAIARPWSVFAAVSGKGVSLIHRNMPTDVDHTFGGLTAGIDYEAFQGMHIGAFFNYTLGEANLTARAYSDTKLDAFHVATFASSTSAYGFIDALAGLGYDKLSQSRTGSFGKVTASPNGATYFAALRAGRLFDLGSVRLGPVGSLSSVAAYIGSYKETGAALSQLTVGAHWDKSFVGGVGAQLKPAESLMWPVNPTLTVTYEQAFLKGPQQIPTAFTYLPTQTLPTATIVAQNAVRVELGADYAATPQLAVSLSTYGLLATQWTYSLGFSGHMMYRF